MPKEIALDPGVLERYVGRYQLAPAAIITITRQDARLFAQLTGQPAIVKLRSAPAEAEAGAGPAGQIGAAGAVPLLRGARTARSVLRHSPPMFVVTRTADLPKVFNGPARVARSTRESPSNP